MSVIAALCWGDGATWIGSDTLVTSANLKLMLGSKWIVRKGWAVGVAGHLRTMNIIDHHAEDLFAEVAGPYVLADRLRTILQQDGFHEGNEERGPVEFGQSLMLAHAAGVWSLGSDFSTIALPPGRLWAEGSGRDLAIGAAHALAAARPALGPFEIVRRALETAIALDIGSGGQPWIFELTPEARHSAREVGSSPHG